ncbi:hypothetical protein GIB67_006425 [Kingdonia uniflora]|uniref:CS domain-containing protein n=1 Tax=Kingdonia uniflora TaxID=39325 RepID=A0A7J7P0S7_9MAGN|nr:hypothetical protein GIB67_006425 [Kingdonia uniflora]
MAVIADYQEENDHKEQNLSETSENTVESSKMDTQKVNEEPQMKTSEKEEPKKNNVLDVLCNLSSYSILNVIASFFEIVPNKGNGMDMENYSWTQFLPEVTINVPVPQGTRSRSVVCEIKRKSLKVGLKGQPLIIDGEFFDSVKLDDCFWSMEDEKLITILLTKQNQRDWWKFLLKGHPEIDTQKVEPDTSKLSDLDPETRATVEKMMFDRQQKQMGRPTSDEMEKQDMMKKFMAQNPNMDFSKANFA